MKRVLFIGLVWPEPNSSAAGARMMQLVSFFKEMNFEITFSSAASQSEFSEDLQSFGIESKSITLNCDSFDTFVKDLNPEVVIFDRYITEEHYGWRVLECCPDAMRILDTEDLHCLRLARQNAFKKDVVFDKTNLLTEPIAKREIASILRCDLTLVISEYEIHLLNDFFKVDKALLYYLPLFINDEFEQESNYWLGFEQRTDFVFIGNFLHEPNWNAVLYLKQSIWPLIRKQLLASNLHIYGAYPSQKVFQLHDVRTGFLVHGRALNSREVIENAKVLLAPLRFGAGIKGKLLEAMQYGTPSVTTQIGAEGMNAELDWNGMIADSATEFALNAVELFQNKNLWEQSQQKGKSIIDSRFLKSKFDVNFKLQFAAIFDDLEKHREQNFFGALLLNNMFLSTKYMSLWIAEKNANKNDI